MIPKKYSVLGVGVSAVNYETATHCVIEAAREGRPFGVTALAVHGVMTGALELDHRRRLNRLDLITPDGQPVRWFLNARYRLGLRDRVYGPTLTLHILEAAAREGLPVYFYGSRREVVETLGRRMQERFPGLVVAGARPSAFRKISHAEKEEIISSIRDSGARIAFIGLGCPRQEIFAYEYRDALKMPVLAVGAAFDYHSGILAEPPEIWQRLGLQWLYRLCQEPRRLWKRYLLFNTGFVALATLQLLRLWRPSAAPDAAAVPEVLVA